MQLSFSRGFSHGFLDGNNHKVLVRGDYAKKRGIFLGVVESVTGAGVRLDAGRAGQAGRRPGLRRRRVDRARRARRPRLRGDPAWTGGRTQRGIGAETGFTRPRRAPVRPRGDRPAPARGRPAGLEDRRPRADPPAAPDRSKARRTARSTSTSTSSPWPASRCGSPGEPRPATQRHGPVGRAARPSPSAGRPTNRSSRRSSAGWAARSTSSAALDATIDGGPMVPMSLLNRLAPRAGRAARRGGRGAAASIDRRRARPAGAPRADRRRTGPRGAHAAILRRSSCRSSAAGPTRSRRPSRAGISTIYADYQDIKEYAEAVAAARRRRRGDLPGDPADREARRGQPLPASWPSKGPTASSSATRAGMRFCSEHGIPFVADFSLNAANPLTVELFKSRGARAGDGLVRPERRPALATCSTRRRRRGWKS